ncbi:MAG: hypothetical protein AABP62_09835 [Planctomycetota bacterium]
MSLITIEVEIDHGSLTVKEPHLLPERGTGMLTVVRSEGTPPPERIRVTLPLIHCVPGTIIDPTAEELDDSLWN